QCGNPRLQRPFKKDFFTASGRKLAEARSYIGQRKRARDTSVGFSEMTTRQYGSLSFDPPLAWSDRTIFVFSAPSDGPATPPDNVVVTREPRRGAESVAAHAMTWMVDLAGKLDGFALADSSDMVVGGRTAARTHFRYETELGHKHQIVVFV